MPRRGIMSILREHGAVPNGNTNAMGSTVSGQVRIQILARLIDWGPTDHSGSKANPDRKTAEGAAAFLDGSKDHDKPFFLGCGIYLARTFPGMPRRNSSTCIHS